MEQGSTDPHEERLIEIISAYRDAAQVELDRRWAEWPLEPSQNEVHEVVGALLARQVTLAIELVSLPPSWTSHTAPLVLRAMVDLRISLGWILYDPAPRAQKFIRYGLGQAKLLMEHAKARVSAAGGDPDNDETIKGMRTWIDTQRFHFLTEVNVGSWSDTDVRTMARECGCEELYQSAYPTWSAATHNMWHHVHSYNLQPCTNPLHRGGHRVPYVPSSFNPDLSYALRAAEYLDETFRAFDTFRGVKPDCPSASELFEREVANLGDAIAAAQNVPAEEG